MAKYATTSKGIIKFHGNCKSQRITAGCKIAFGSFHHIAMAKVANLYKGQTDDKRYATHILSEVNNNGNTNTNNEPSRTTARQPVTVRVQ